MKWRRGSVEALAALARRCVLVAGRLRPTSKQLVRALEPWELVAKPPAPPAAPQEAPASARAAPSGRRGSGPLTPGRDAALWRQQSTPVRLAAADTPLPPASLPTPPPAAAAAQPSPRPGLAQSGRVRCHGTDIFDILDRDDLPLAGAERLLRVRSSAAGLDSAPAGAPSPSGGGALGLPSARSGADLAASASAGSFGCDRADDAGPGGGAIAAENLCIVCLVNPRVSCRHLQLCSACSGGAPGVAAPGYCPGCGAVDLGWAPAPGGSRDDLPRARAPAADDPTRLLVLRLVSPLPLLLSFALAAKAAATAPC